MAKHDRLPHALLKSNIAQQLVSNRGPNVACFFGEGMQCGGTISGQSCRCSNANDQNTRLGLAAVLSLASSLSGCSCTQNSSDTQHCEMAQSFEGSISQQEKSVSASKMSNASNIPYLVTKFSAVCGWYEARLREPADSRSRLSFQFGMMTR